MTSECIYPGSDTRQAAEAEVARCLGDFAAEHNVPAISDRCRDLAGSWDVRQVKRLSSKSR